MLKKQLKIVSQLIVIIAVLILPYFVFAVSPLDNLKEVGSTNGPYESSTTQYDVFIVIGTAIRGLLSLLGVIFVVLIVYAGYNWMTASGDESKVEKASDTIKRAIIGLIITVGAYAIQAFVFSRLLN